MDPSLKIVIVDESPVRAAILADGLREAGFTQVIRLEETNNLLAHVYAIDRPRSMRASPPISWTGSRRSA
jgi:response regulator NasT